MEETLPVKSIENFVSCPLTEMCNSDYKLESPVSFALLTGYKSSNVSYGSFPFAYLKEEFLKIIFSTPWLAPFGPRYKNSAAIRSQDVLWKEGVERVLTLDHGQICFKAELIPGTELLSPLSEL